MSSKAERRAAREKVAAHVIATTPTDWRERRAPKQRQGVSSFPAQPRQVDRRLAMLLGLSLMQVSLLDEAQSVGTAHADRVMGDRELGGVDALWPREEPESDLSLGHQ